MQVGEVIPYQGTRQSPSDPADPGSLIPLLEMGKKVTKTLFRSVGLEPRHVTFVKNVHEIFLADVEGSEICPLFLGVSVLSQMECSMD